MYHSPDTISAQQNLQSLKAIGSKLNIEKQLKTLIICHQVVVLNEYLIITKLKTRYWGREK
jgi:hypothetical protein